MSFVCPAPKCELCPRLVEFRKQNELKFPSFYNGAVESFGDLNSQILVVGLAPGLKGANQTARPFTNDYAGDVLYPILKANGLATGNYQKIKNDGFELVNVRVTNAVRCVPPKNMVTTDEVKTCGQFLQQELKAMPNLKLILVLGGVAHNAVLSILGYTKAHYKFAHGAVHKLEKHHLLMLDSYHTSRYNINTGVLSYEMFDKIIKQARDFID